MLRITTHDLADRRAIQLEGRLTGPWVQELETTWERAMNERHGQTICVDLSAVTYVDPDGKKLLVLMCRQGAELTAAGCLMKAVVAEAVRRSSSPETSDPSH